MKSPLALGSLLLAICAPTISANQHAQDNDGSALNAKRLSEIEEGRQKGLNQWRTPIEFYGLVADESANPVEGAQIEFACNDLTPSGTSFYKATSNSAGLFSIKGISGKLLAVKVSKPGYYGYKPFGAAFTYAGENQNFVPNAAKPVAFRLKKKGPTEPLAHIEAPLGGAKGFKIATDGTPVEISLTTGMIVLQGEGDLRIECRTDIQGKSPGQKYDWRCQVSVPHGGLVQSTDDLEFQAPLEGYHPSDVINMPTTLDVDWSNNAKRTYFLKLAGGKYARVNFEMVAGGDHFFRLESFLNPSGSRNLEFEPSKVVRQKP